MNDEISSQPQPSKEQERRRSVLSSHMNASLPSHSFQGVGPSSFTLLFWSVDSINKISVILKLVHPLAKGIGARWVWSRGRRYLVYMKLDPVKVAWIIRRKETGVLTSEIAHAMSVSERRVQRLWSAYRATGEVPSLKRPGRKHVEATDQEKGIIGKAYARYEVNALTLERVIEVDYGTHITQ